MVLIDARTGKRQPYWAELDSSAPAATARAADPAGAQPARAAAATWWRCAELRTASGRAIAPTFGFRALRDRRATGSKAINARRASMRKVFRPLRRAGVARGNLVLAWDFTVASRRSITSPMLHMRNEAFAGARRHAT